MRAKAPPPSSRRPNADEPAESSKPFRDIGVLGSVDIGATGTGGTSFTVAVGNSGVSGPIGRGGRISGIAAVRPIGRALSPTLSVKAAPPKIASFRDLRQKASPNVRHNRRIKAPYPEQLREADISGEVRALLIVRPDGTVGDVKILKSAHEAFARSAVRVLMQFLFEPALDKHGNAVMSRVALTYRFTLE
jgi:TonB family protein